MKKKYINYSLSLTFLICMFVFISLTKIDHAGPQNQISQDKLTNNDYAQNEESDSYQKIIQKSKAENKKTILFFIDSTCDWSDKFFEILKDSEVNSYISDNNYIKYYVNVEKNKNVFLKYKVEFTPWYIVVDENENIIKTGSGYKQKREFLIWLRSIVKNNSK